MKELQTIGQEFYKGFIVKIYYSDEILFNESNDKNLFQVLYIDEGSVLVGNEGKEKALFTPLLLCLNYTEPQQKIHLANAKGFSIFFKPDAINHGLIGNEVVTTENNSNYLETEKLLLYPFQKSNADNPVALSVNGMIRERLYRMADSIKTQFYDQPDNYWPCRGRSFLLELLMLLQSMYTIETENSVSIASGSENIVKALKDIHLRYCESSFSDKNVSRPKGFRSFLFEHSFKKTTGKKPSVYLRDLRLSLADNLLKNTMLPLDQIAQRCGYETEDSFSSDFQKQKKTTPLAWRALFPNPYGY
ncbi:MAG TPA: AraC family transcriptional regulator [Treponemataceae bacterium]|jgi:AraC-like DNA-binding protein|nr:AraC family transcriptional regulator [Treponemataceae bacterium]